VDRTRQQLEELDALLREMLALPTADAPDEEPRAPAPGPGHPAKDIAPAEGPVVAFRPLPGPAAEPVSVPLACPPEPAPPPADDLARGDSSAEFAIPLWPADPEPDASETAPTKPLLFVPEGDPAPGEEPAPDPAVIAPDPLRLTDIELSLAAAGRDAEQRSTAAVIAPTAAGDDGPPTALAYRGLVQVNALLDRAFGLLGPVGRPLTTPAGRNFLGWLGVVLLVGAAAFCLGAWLGWTW
jgi:hypothetical protein